MQALNEFQRFSLIVTKLSKCSLKSTLLKVGGTSAPHNGNCRPDNTLYAPNESVLPDYGIHILVMCALPHACHEGSLVNTSHIVHSYTHDYHEQCLFHHWDHSCNQDKITVTLTSAPSETMHSVGGIFLVSAHRISLLVSMSVIREANFYP